MRIGPMDGPPTAAVGHGGSPTGPSGTRNPAVPAGQTFNTTLALALAHGVLTQAHIDAVCGFRLGVYWGTLPLRCVRVGFAFVLTVATAVGNRPPPFSPHSMGPSAATAQRTARSRRWSCWLAP